MKLLHTSDWHVGKAIRGASRADEHRAVLAEIAEIAERGERRPGRRGRRPVRLRDADRRGRRDRLPGAARARRDLRTRSWSSPATTTTLAGSGRSLRCSSSVMFTSSPSRPARRRRSLDLQSGDGSRHPAGDAAVRLEARHRAGRATHGQAAFENAQAYTERLRMLIARAVRRRSRIDTVNLLAAHAFVLGGDSWRR